MRRILAILCFALLAATPVAAGEPKCPLDVATCLDQFGKMRDRPWYGIWYDGDVTGKRLIREVVQGGPAEAAGVQPGDELEKIDGTEEVGKIASRAGWRTLPPTEFHVLRNGKEVSLQVTPKRVPEDILARMIGKHMVEAHLAYEHHDDETPKR
jgi:predicted metalloprotease with PDZ domain